MDIFGLVDLFCAVAETGGGPDWRQTWPFGPGYSEGFVSTILKFGLVAVILGAIALFLRLLFGPGGRLRDKEFDVPPPSRPSREAPGGDSAAGPRRDRAPTAHSPEDPRA